MGNRYNEITDKNAREIVLLKGFPCRYGKCSFCNYIEDNSTDEEEINFINKEQLELVTGKYSVLEVINSGSVFELPDDTLRLIKEVAIKKAIKIIYFEIFYTYLPILDKLRKFFNGIELRFRTGIETFDNDFRINIYNKKFSLDLDKIQSLSTKIWSVCLLICVKGQTKEMIEKDIELALKYFNGVTINIFINNGTAIERDEKLVTWFIENYSHLQYHEKVELLIDNKDLGVFEQ